MEGETWNDFLFNEEKELSDKLTKKIDWKTHQDWLKEKAAPKKNNQQSTTLSTKPVDWAEHEKWLSERAKPRRVNSKRDLLRKKLENQKEPEKKVVQWNDHQKWLESRAKPKKSHQLSSSEITRKIIDWEAHNKWLEQNAEPKQVSDWFDDDDGYMSDGAVVDWTSHRKWLEIRAQPKYIYSPIGSPALDRGEKVDLKLLADRLEGLARPRSRREKYTPKPPEPEPMVQNYVNPKALQYEPTPRINELAMPQHKNVLRRPQTEIKNEKLKDATTKKSTTSGPKKKTPP